MDEEGADHLFLRGEGQGVAELGFRALEDPPQVLLVAPEGEEEEGEGGKPFRKAEPPKSVAPKSPRGSPKAARRRSR